MAPKKDNLTVAREFFNRRRSGLDRKAQTLITHESKKHHVDVKVTIVYEYQNEVSFFRSHPTEVGARWFSSFNELKAASRGGSNTNMGSVDQSTLDLLEWQNRQGRGLTTNPPQVKTEVTDEDILNSTHPSLFGNGAIEGLSPNNSEDEGCSDDESAEEESDSSDDNEYHDEGKVPRKARVESRVHLDNSRTSPKRRRTEDGDQNLAQYQTPPIMYPQYNTYPGSNGQIPVPGQLQLTGPGPNIGGYSLQTQQNQNHQDLLAASDPFGAYNIGNLTQPFASPGYQAEANPMSVRTRRPPQVPQAKKGKNSKSTSRGRTSGRRKTIQ